MELILNTAGMRISKRNDCFHLLSEGNERLISPKRISSIVVLCNLSITSGAIGMAVKNEIPIIFLSQSGKVIGTIISHTFKGIAKTRRNQIRFAESNEATKWIIRLFKLKYEAQSKNIRWFVNQFNASHEILSKWDNTKNYLLELDSYANELISNSLNSILGFEGIISRSYWETVSLIAGSEFGFISRSRRPAKDMINALLNYYYGMLYGKVERAILSCGLDPYLGILHADAYNKPTLVFDLIEPFRPWADRLIFKMCKMGKLTLDNFDFKDNAVWLNRQGKAVYIPVFNDFMKERVNFNSSVKTCYNHIIALCRDFVKTINSIPK